MDSGADPSLCRAVVAEWSIDRVLITHEMDEIGPQRVAELAHVLGLVPIVRISHLELKRLTAEGRATVRTADTTPYANIIVVSG